MSRLRDYAWLEARLGVKRATLQCWVSRNLVPVVRLAPRSPRFDEQAIENWIAAKSSPGQSKAADELDAARVALAERSRQRRAG